ncbi:uncharacterized protein LOC124135714 isoform X1 [Haliotis rufescens]|uniref:uncharacterized protein LOC124135714 isoform X1 n=1 Tax=Haliotis rufescens TaxID=6454 RepID=UPI001EB095DB|nr:uncharacterized protein LOC124135714 isoform X1 [Haliotis rufescens]
MEMDFLKDFSDKWQLNKKTVKSLEGNNIVLEEDFLDLSDSDIENLGLTIGQKNALKRGISIVRMSTTMTQECGEDIAQRESRVQDLSNSLANMSFYSCMAEDQTDSKLMEMGFIKNTLYLGLRYVFLFLLLGYHTLAKLWNTLLAPFEPIKVEARKVAPQDVSFQGIVGTLKRLVFLAVLVWAHLVQSFLDRVMQPVHNIAENMSDFVERYDPHTTSRMVKVE